MKLSFEAAKQQVAEKHGYASWIDIQDYCFRDNDAVRLDFHYEEALELMCNEAVKADRASIGKELDDNSLNYDGKVTRYEEYLTSESLPLPFPEK